MHLIHILMNHHQMDHDMLPFKLLLFCACLLFSLPIDLYVIMIRVFAGKKKKKEMAQRKRKGKEGKKKIE